MADVSVVTDAGLAIITNRMTGAGTEPKWVDMGTGTTAPTHSDTDLETPGPEARVEGTVSRVTTNVANDTYRVSATMTKETAAGDITEVGSFDALTGGNMATRTVIGSIHLEVGNSIQWQIDQVFEQG